MTKLRGTGVTVVAAVALVLLPGAQAAAGDLDLTFGGDGTVVTAFGHTGEWDAATGVAIQPDAKIVVSGGARGIPGCCDTRWALARYNPDGTLDATFDGDGRLVEAAGGARDVAIQPDGKIVAAGGIGGLLTVARYLDDGSPDHNFGTAGKVQLQLGAGSNAGAGALEIQPDGKIVVGGTLIAGGTADAVLARLRTDGALDESFGVGGKIVTDLGDGEFDSVTDLAMTNTGKVLISAAANTADSDFLVARYKADGTLDESFGAGGKRFTDFNGSFDRAAALALGPGGSIVLAGSSRSALSFGFAVARYTPDGSLDSTFSEDGRAVVLPHTQGATTVEVQADGRILVVGTSGGFNLDFVATRFLTGGTLDSSFGGDGIVQTDIAGSSDFAYGSVLDSAGNLVVVGDSRAPNNPDWAIARYLAGGDSEPPVLQLPGDLTAEATGPSGAIVTFSTSATDKVDPNPLVSCEPESGSMFHLGATVVACTATDASGNNATGAFTLTVVDSTAPTVTASLNPLSESDDDGKWFVARWACIDLVDTAPIAVGDLNGIALAEGSIVRPKRSRGTAYARFTDDGVLKIKDVAFVLTVQCTDAVGNSSAVSVEPVFGREDED